MKRRAFLIRGLVAAGTFAAGPGEITGAEYRYRLAPATVLPPDIMKAPREVREAYRFAILNGETLRYIPCYCGCGSAGHTSNASCYLKDGSIATNLQFDRMSLA